MTAIVALLLLCPLMVAAEDGRRNISDVETRSRWMERLSGQHFTAQVRLRIIRGESQEERELSVWRDDPGGSRERLMARFISPADMRGFGLLYLENAGRPNDYFIYQPSQHRVRRVPESYARQDVYGVDLEYLGFGIAQLEPTEVESLSVDVFQDRPALKLTERAERANQRFERREIWLDPESFVALRAVHHRNGRVTLTATTEEIRKVQGVPTPVRISFDRPLEDERVIMTVDAIDYRSPIPEAFFSTLKLIKHGGHRRSQPRD